MGPIISGSGTHGGHASPQTFVVSGSAKAQSANPHQPTPIVLNLETVESSTPPERVSFEDFQRIKTVFAFFLVPSHFLLFGIDRPRKLREDFTREEENERRVLCAQNPPKIGYHPRRSNPTH
jgi:hypothetical protein